MQIELDMTDPKVAEMVNDWEDGGKYFMSLLVTQKTHDGKSALFEIDGIEDYGPSDHEPMEEMEAEAEGEEMGMEDGMGEGMEAQGDKEKKPKAVVISFG